MDVINISRSRRFLRERPMHVNLFDRPRLVVDLLCLESGQEESRRGFDRSDSLVVLTEGEARLRAGPQIESLQEMDAVLVPPGQQYLITNTGAGQMVALVMVTPKPSRADEVRVPGDTRPFRTVRPDREEDAGAERSQSRGSFREQGNAPRERSFTSRDDRPQRDRPFQRRDDAGSRGSYPRRDEAGPRGAYPRRDEASARGPAPRRDDSGERSGYPRRNDGGQRSPYPRRDDAGPRDAFPRRDNGPPGRAPYPRRDGAPNRGGGGPGNFQRGRPFQRDEAAGSEERTGPRRGNTGARPPRRNEGEGPVWFPKPKPAWRPRGAPPAGTSGGRGRPSDSRDGAGRGSGGGRPPRRNGEGGPAGGRGPRGFGGAPGGPRGRSGGFESRPPARGAGPRRNDNKKTGDARRASRGQGPLSGRRGPGRSGPRT